MWLFNVHCEEHKHIKKCLYIFSLLIYLFYFECVLIKVGYHTFSHISDKRFFPVAIYFFFVGQIMLISFYICSPLVPGLRYDRAGPRLQGCAGQTTQVGFSWVSYVCSALYLSRHFIMAEISTRDGRSRGRDSNH